MKIADKDKARILNHQFSSIFSLDDQKTPEIKSPRASDMDDIIITTGGVKKLLDDLNVHKANGPDGIPARILQETSNEIAKAMALLFKVSLTQSDIPNTSGEALISPLFKGGKKDRYKAENKRPISLTSISCKVLEHILHSNIMKHLENNNILTDLQHGFRKHRSCETQLIKTVNYLAKSMNHGEQIDSILLDFSKAFDKVCHRKLLLKLEYYGIRGRKLQWIKKLLENRTQKFAVAGVTSSVSAVTSSVPQGTVLGPLLFLIYINDMPSTASSTIGVFADDTYICRSIRNIDDYKILQEDLQKLMQWEQSWSMTFHPHKCKVLRITNKRKVIKYRYLLHNVIPKEVSNTKYLGVTMIIVEKGCS